MGGDTIGCWWFSRKKNTGGARSWWCRYFFFRGIFLIFLDFAWFIPGLKGISFVFIYIFLLIFLGILEFTCRCLFGWLVINLEFREKEKTKKGRKSREEGLQAFWLHFNLVCLFQVAKDGNSPFTYIIVDDQTWGPTYAYILSLSLSRMLSLLQSSDFLINVKWYCRKTRTCIHTAGYPPMQPDELSQSSVVSLLDGARIVHFDGRLHETALVVAKEVIYQSLFWCFISFWLVHRLISRLLYNWFPTNLFQPEIIKTAICFHCKEDFVELHDIFSLEPF